MAKKQESKAVQARFTGERIIPKAMEDCLHDSMMPYAEHVILDRALPRVEDGLKPVQRRILYTMMELGVTPDKPHRKSARIVGDCLGKYHPHGDTSVYDAMVRMAQDFSLRMPLVDGHGNFGSIDGDTAAAMRYTEARMSPMALELLRDIDCDTVKFELNFDDTLSEPVVLPGRFPNLLVNGSNGIAVGLATNIPPHNLTESINACLAYLENPKISLAGLMDIIPCPDFPTGGHILNSDEIRTAYATGRGRVIMRGKTHIETLKNGKSLIVITELPYQVNKTQLLKKILDVGQKKRDTDRLFSYISDIRDESDRHGIRAVVEVKKDADPNLVLSALYKYTDLQCTFGVNMVVISEGKPKQMGLIDIIREYMAYQETIITRRTKYELDAALKREHVLDGLLIALLNIDEVIALIRASSNAREAKEKLTARFGLTEVQAQAILDLRLQRLTSLEKLAIEKEAQEIKKIISNLQSILASKKKLHTVIRKELMEIRDKYAALSARRTTMIADDTERIAAHIAEETGAQAVYDVSVDVYSDASLMCKQPGSAVSMEDAAYSLWQTFQTQTNKQLKLFTNAGSCLTVNVSDIPEVPKGKRGVKPTRLASLIPLENDERVVAVFCVDPSDGNIEGGDYLFYTRSGNVKRTQASEYLGKKARIGALVLKDGDELLAVERAENETVMLVSERGMSIRFTTESIPSMGRMSAGVKCMKLELNDRVIFARQIEDKGELLCITDRGYAKRSFIFDYDVQGRNGKGVKTFDFRKNGSNGTKLIAAFYVLEAYDIQTTQLHDTQTIFNTDSVPIERRASFGKVVVVSVLDDVLISAISINGEQRTNNK